MPFGQTQTDEAGVGISDELGIRTTRTVELSLCRFMQGRVIWHVGVLTRLDRESRVRPVQRRLVMREHRGLHRPPVLIYRCSMRTLRLGSAVLA